MFKCKSNYLRKITGSLYKFLGGVNDTTAILFGVQSSAVTGFASSNDSPDESIHLHPGKIGGVRIKVSSLNWVNYGKLKPQTNV